jgi:RNA polymerase sigma factor (sigma-70 family)
MAHCEVVKQALGEVLEAISDEQRRLLRLHFVDGLTMEAIARQLGVNRSTIMRRLDACADALWAALRERLGREPLPSDLELTLGEYSKTRS